MKTALILGGGGPIGIAWEAGLLMGLEERGLRLDSITRIVGTSAGAIVGAHLASTGSVATLFAGQSTPLDDTIKPPKMAPLLAAFLKAKLFTSSLEAQRCSMGKSAREAKVGGEAEWLAAIAGFLPEQARGAAWPKQELLLTSVDADSGELVAWTREHGVPLAQAVAASCAVPCVYPLVGIGGRLYMDGGIGSAVNASLGANHELVIALDPLARMPGGNNAVKAELAALRSAGSRVVAFVFDDAAHALIGMNLMDMRQRASVAELGRRQAHTDPEATRLAPLLSDAPPR